MRAENYRKLAISLKVIAIWMIIYSYPAVIMEMMEDTTIKHHIIGFLIGMFFCALFLLVRKHSFESPDRKMEKDIMSPGLFFLYIIPFILAYVNNLDFFYRALLVYFIITLILYLLNGYFANYSHELSGMKRREALAYASAAKDQHTLYFKFIFILFLICFSMIFIPFSKTMKQNASNIKELMKGDEPKQTVTTYEEPVQQESEANENYEEVDVVPIIIGFNVIVVLIIIWEAVSVVRERKNKVKPLEYAKNGNILITENIVKEKKEEKKDKRPGMFDMDPASRIRRYFIKSGLRVNVTGIMKSDTPSEIINEQSFSSPEYKLRSLYEKARYSALECTKEDAVCAKKCMNEIKKNG